MFLNLLLLSAVILLTAITSDIIPSCYFVHSSQSNSDKDTTSESGTSAERASVIESSSGQTIPSRLRAVNIEKDLADKEAKYSSPIYQNEMKTKEGYGIDNSPNAALFRKRWRNIIYKSNYYMDYEDLHRKDDNQGPLYVRCIKVNPDRNETDILMDESVGDWPAEGPNAVVQLRSVSKILAASTFLVLSEGNQSLNLDTTVGAYFPKCGELSKATVRDLLSLRFMDNRLNAYRTVQRRSQKLEADHVGWPNLCDELGFDPLECVQQFICPSYEPDDSPVRDQVKDKSILVPLSGKIGGWDDNADFSCKNKHQYCNFWSKEDICVENPRFGLSECSLRCLVEECCDLIPNCVNAIKDVKEGCKSVSAKQRELCKRTCQLCSPSGVWAYKASDESNEAPSKVLKGSRWESTYDNYSYTIVDAMVKLATSKFLAEWVQSLLYEPLGMLGSLKCLKSQEETCINNECKAEDGFNCYTPPSNINDTLNSEMWPKNVYFGPASKSWISNALHASASDLTHFIEMMLNNGTYRGKRILSLDAIKNVFTPHNLPYLKRGSFIGSHAFGIGLGYCHHADFHMREYEQNLKTPREFTSGFSPSTSFCNAPDVWVSLCHYLLFCFS